MDGQWDRATIPSEIPKSQPIGVGMSNSFTVWFYVHWIPDNWCHSWSRLPARQRNGPRRFGRRKRRGFVIFLTSNSSSPRTRFSSMPKAILASIIFNTVRSTSGREVLFRISLRIVTMPLNIPEAWGLVQTSRMFIPCQCLLLRCVRLLDSDLPRPRSVLSPARYKDCPLPRSRGFCCLPHGL